VTSQLALTTPSLLAIERAREIIAACKDIDEVKSIKDRAEAVKVLLREQGAAVDAQNHAAEIGMRAFRRMGQMLRESVRHEGGRPKKNGASQEPFQRLEDLGVSKKQSALAQQLAAVPDTEFDRRVDLVRASAEKLTQAAITGKGVKQKGEGLQCRRTPLWVFKALERFFGVTFVLDAYASADNAMCAKFYAAADDGNVQPWLDATFANPEFEDMDFPMQQAVAQAKRGVLSVMLGPVGCTQKWFHDFAIKGTIFNPDCRISYDLPDGTPTNGADRDTQVFAFGKEWTNKSQQGDVFRVRSLPLVELRKEVA
jgi:phage N-6-adenine-methyltransferase